MAHRRAMLTPFGRLLLVQRVRQMNWSVPRAAESMGVSRMTAYKWLRRFDEGGPEALEDRSSRPHDSPLTTPPDVAAAVLGLRHSKRWGPHRIGPAVGLARSTVYAVLRRAGESRLSDGDRSTGVRIRYVRDHPGELVHIDVKKLGRIPDGGGHAILGNPARVRRGGGWEFMHVSIDDCSRVAYAELRQSDDGANAAQFLIAASLYYRSLGVHIERVMTDRAYAYMQSKLFQRALVEIGARHKPTAPFRPQTNGKAEAFIKTSLREWAYVQLYTTNQERHDALKIWLDFYNNHRTHTELQNRTPMDALVNNVSEQYN
jgi:transposase InsO family protein/transposase-like protein